MYWYKPSAKIYLFISTGFILLLGIAACKNDIRKSSAKSNVFDLKGYFESESIRLTKLNPLITKTVIHDTISETKKMHISNWETELSLFSESDINKPAWKASYRVQKSKDFLIYKATDPDSLLKTRDIIIKRSGNKIKWILIFNHVTTKFAKKKIYESVEKLTYYPDSLYQIKKTQRVRLMGTNTYKISGAFN